MSAYSVCVPDETRPASNNQPQSLPTNSRSQQMPTCNPSIGRGMMLSTKERVSSLALLLSSPENVPLQHNHPFLLLPPRGRSDDVSLLVLGVLALHAPGTRDPFSLSVILLHPSRPREDLLSSSPQHYQYTSRYITRQSTSR